MTYTKLERIAIARIISDIVRADNIIARGELSMLNRLKTKYHLTSEDQKDARKNKGDFIRNYPKISCATIKSRQRAL